MQTDTETLADRLQKIWPMGWKDITGCFGNRAEISNHVCQISAARFSTPIPKLVAWTNEERKLIDEVDKLQKQVAKLEGKLADMRDDQLVACGACQGTGKLDFGYGEQYECSCKNGYVQRRFQDVRHAFAGAR